MQSPIAQYNFLYKKKITANLRKCKIVMEDMIHLLVKIKKDSV